MSDNESPAAPSPMRLQTTAFSFVFDSNPARSLDLNRRTNSLGWANVDCFTCQALKKPCDRQRPRCNACSQTGITCRGFSQKLKWQNPTASRSKWAQKAIRQHQDPSSRHQTQMGPTAATFTFIREDGTKRQKCVGRDRERTAEFQPNPSQALFTVAASRIGVLPPSPPDELESALVPATKGSLELPMYGSITNPFRLSSQVIETLDFYRWNFSFIMLTYNVDSNPWQMCVPMAIDNPCLMDAIVALGSRYRARLLQEIEDLQVLKLKDRALYSFRTVLKSANPAVLIGTILILVALEYAETGYSNWSVHFQGALMLIEAEGGIAMANENAALQGQIAMLAWYDVTSSLFSRRAPIFPRHYTEALMSWRTASGWSLLALNGFPDDLFLDFYDLVSAASRGVDEEEMSDLEKRVWAVRLDSSNPQINCLLRCWRLTLLLYCARALQRGPSTLHRIDSLSADDLFDRSRTFDAFSVVEARCNSLAQEILYVACEIPPNSPCQKQCLVPVTLAACEIRSDHQQNHFRVMAEEYCHRWSEQSRLPAFNTALDLMKTAWHLTDGGHRADGEWWGDTMRMAMGSETLPALFHRCSDDVDGVDRGKDWLLG